MKKITAILLALLLFCSCGFVEDGKFDAPPQPPKLSEISGKGITVTESFVAGKTEEISEKFIIQKWEDERLILLKPLDEEKETKVSYLAKEGEASEYRIDFTEFYGELSSGKYRLVFGFVKPEESGKYKNIGYTKIDFEIE
ncbi:MAG: hypothetical protein IKL18_07595 [Oscillospiraceae bacterium]|nr:hypothetical protein [Oscillospiraceae bacterium]